MTSWWWVPSGSMDKCSNSSMRGFRQAAWMSSSMDDHSDISVVIQGSIGQHQAAWTKCCKDTSTSNVPVAGVVDWWWSGGLVVDQS